MSAAKYRTIAVDLWYNSEKASNRNVMSTTYYLLPIPAHKLAEFNSWRELPDLGIGLKFDEIVQSLERLWSNVTIEINLNSIEWVLEDEDGTISGMLELPYIVTFQLGSMRRVVEFVNWYRELISDEYTLYLFHLGQPKELKIKGNTQITETDLEIL